MFNPKEFLAAMADNTYEAGVHDGFKAFERSHPCEFTHYRNTVVYSAQATLGAPRMPVEPQDVNFALGHMDGYEAARDAFHDAERYWAA